MKIKNRYCSNCKVDLRGDPIPKKDRKHYSPPYFWGREIAIYSLEEDRTIAFQCPDCGFRRGR